MAVALSFVEGLWTRCHSMLDSGQHGLARTMLSRLLQMDLPASLRSEATLMLADLLRLQGEYESARRHLKAALAGDPQDPSLHHMLGYLHDEDNDTGNETRAHEHLKAAVKLAPDSSECHRALGDFLFHHTNEKRGLAHLRKAVQLEPDNLDSLRSLIGALVQQGEIDQARQLIREQQFRLGRAHPTVQSLWNELTYAHTLKQQQQKSRLATVPMLKAVSQSSDKTVKSAMPSILRFDAAHRGPSRTSRRRTQRPQDR